MIRPGSFYSVTYYKPENSPQLLAKRMADHDDLRISMTAAEFLTEAWRLANDKARELGWIDLKDGNLRSLAKREREKSGYLLAWLQ